MTSSQRIASLYRHAILAAQRTGSRILSDRLRPHGLTPAWAEVLVVLADHGPLTIRELGKLLVCESDHPSRLVSRMEQAGWIERTPNVGDRRAFLVELTRRGKSGARLARKIEADWDRELLKRTSEAQMLVVAKTLMEAVAGTEVRATLEARFGNPE